MISTLAESIEIAKKEGKGIVIVGHSLWIETALEAVIEGGKRGRVDAELLGPQ